MFILSLSLCLSGPITWFGLGDAIFFGRNNLSGPIPLQICNFFEFSFHSPRPAAIPTMITVSPLPSPFSFYFELKADHLDTIYPTLLLLGEVGIRKIVYPWQLTWFHSFYSNWYVFYFYKYNDSCKNYCNLKFWSLEILRMTTMLMKRLLLLPMMMMIYI